MALDPRTPVLVGAAAAAQRFDDPLAGVPVIELMVRACVQAAEDAGARTLLRDADAVLVPRGTWSHANGAGAIAERIGAAGARAVVAEVGILQTTLFRSAADAIASGRADVAIVSGGEAKWRDLRATIAGIVLDDDEGDDLPPPDEHLTPHGEIISRDEIAAGLINAVSQYTLIENARRAARGQSLHAHLDTIGALWAGFSAVAQRNPDAWNRQPMTAEQIRTPGPKNRPLAFPYNKWHNSQWNVDQAGALILCSVEAARRHGVPEARWVFPHAIVESNHMVPVSQRGALHRSPGFEIAGRRAFELAGVSPGELGPVDLYSCFPIAVATQVDELGLAPERPLTVTGGMAFGGGPLNNYVVQSTVAMAHALRAEPGSRGLVTAISGIITKQGVGVWSTEPPARGYTGEDVSDQVDAATARVVTSTSPEDAGRIATYTVLYDDAGPTRGVVVADREDGTRSVAATTDADLAAAMTTEEFIGRAVQLDGTGGFTVA
jgi:acetyl-CoA C-acetyltransferase